MEVLAMLYYAKINWMEDIMQWKKFALRTKACRSMTEFYGKFTF